MLMSYMHCSIIRNVTHEYRALADVTALSSLVVPGAGFLVARSATEGGRVVTVKTLLFVVKMFQAVAGAGRSHFCGVFVTGGTGGFHYENLRCGRRREYGIEMTASASREQRLSFWWNYTYWYQNRHPIVLWSRYFMVDSICISFLMCLLWI